MPQFWEAVGVILGLAMVIGLVVAGFAWLVVLPTIGLLYVCGWL